MKWSTQRSRTYVLIVALVSSVLLCCSFCVAQADDELTDLFAEIPLEGSEKGDSHQQDEDVTALERDPTALLVDDRKRKFAGWGPYLPAIKELCRSLLVDGRALDLKDIVDQDLERNVHCPACYPLFKVISLGCQPKKEKPKRGKKNLDKEPKEASVESALPAVASAAPAPLIKKQREPSLTTRTVMDSFLEKLLEDIKRREEGSIAIRRLATLIEKNEEDVTPGKKEYFSYLTEMMNRFSGEFTREEEDRESSISHDLERSGIHIGKATEESVDELFE